MCLLGGSQRYATVVDRDVSCNLMSWFVIDTLECDSSEMFFGLMVWLHMRQTVQSITNQTKPDIKLRRRHCIPLLHSKM